VREVAIGLFSGKTTTRLVDLGCGSGANLRALAPYFPARQSWLLVDHDRALLDAARDTLAGWADAHETRAGGGLWLCKGAAGIDVAFRQADLAGDFDHVLAPHIDLVTASAFFDLVAASWIARFCSALVARRLPLYAVLTYDGAEHWRPPHAGDGAMLAAFHAHQATDKGFGLAAGPNTLAALTEGFAAPGWQIVTGPSPWRLGPSDAALIARLAEGSARAVRETGRVVDADIAGWLSSRRVAGECEIGHVDFLARPVR
jgi:SAM-dependent methyltransferase